MNTSGRLRRKWALRDDVINICGALEIAKFGVMQTPALVVDGKVVSKGKMSKVEDVKNIFFQVGGKVKWVLYTWGH